jgi:hypothetical protein
MFSSWQRHAIVFNMGLLQNKEKSHLKLLRSWGTLETSDILKSIKGYLIENLMPRVGDEIMCVARIVCPPFMGGFMGVVP